MNRKRKRGLLAIFSLVLLVSAALCGKAALSARAETGDVFSIDAELLPSDNETYSIRLTIENQGDDWEGVVRLMVDEDYRKPAAFDTALSLPQGSKKQFVVKVPVKSIENSSTVEVTLLDSRGEEAAWKQFKRLLAGQMESLSMGILSDAYSKLTYLDMGGAELYFYNSRYPISLVQLEQGSLTDMLDGLTFLVIDQYNTGILTEEEMEAIELWNLNGGVLILGTGEYAEDTLRGFDGGYVDIRFWGTHSPQDAPDSSVSGGISSTLVDMEELTLADLTVMNSMYINNDTGSWTEQMRSGGLCVTPYSLTELGELSELYWFIDQETFVYLLLDNASDMTATRYSASVYYDSLDMYIGRLLGVLGNSNSILNFGALKAIVVLYVIFVGPVLYLILRLAKRRELYWAAVPATALLGVILIYFAGRGFEVVSTKVYSVTVKDLDSGKNSVSYLHCYDADRREWSLRLNESCEYVGSFGVSYAYGSDTPYYYHIRKEGDTFFMGMNPDTNFEDGYFYLSSSGNGDSAEGSLLMQDLSVDLLGDASGTIVNDTNKDMKYFAVIWHDTVQVYEGLAAGEACTLENVRPLYKLTGYYYGSYIYDFVSDYYDDGDYREASAASALGVGIFDVYPLAERNEFIVVGVVENWDKTVDDNCSEISYGCLYSVQ